MKVFYANLIISIALIVGGFFVPPLGIIDGSVLTAVGLLLMFTVLAQVPSIVEAAMNGKTIKLQNGDLSITAGGSLRGPQGELGSPLINEASVNQD